MRYVAASASDQRDASIEEPQPEPVHEQHQRRAEQGVEQQRRQVAGAEERVHGPEHVGVERRQEERLAAQPVAAGDAQAPVAVHERVDRRLRVERVVRDHLLQVQQAQPEREREDRCADPALRAHRRTLRPARGERQREDAERLQRQQRERRRP
jgi:hypothetical protein